MTKKPKHIRGVPKGFPKGGPSGLWIPHGKGASTAPVVDNDYFGAAYIGNDYNGNDHF